MTRYQYLGVDTAVTLSDGSSRRLVHGREVELPEGSAFVRGLLERGLLRLAAEAPAPTEPEPEPEPVRETWVEPEVWTPSGVAEDELGDEHPDAPAPASRRGKRKRS